MSFREKGSRAMVGVLVIVCGWHLASVIRQVDGGPAADVAFQGTAVVAAIATVVIAAVSHIGLAATGSAWSPSNDTGVTETKRYARSPGGVVTAAAAVAGNDPGYGRNRLLLGRQRRCGGSGHRRADIVVLRDQDPPAWCMT